MARRFHCVRFVCLVAFVIVGGSLMSQDVSLGSQVGTHNKLALLVGINDYKYKGEYLKPLYGAVNDVMNMKRLLVERFGFPDDDDHIRVLTDEQATRDAGLARTVRSIDHHKKRGGSSWRK